MIIKDLKSGEYKRILDAKLLSAFNPLLETVEVYDKGNGNTYKFRIGDAILAGIQIPRERTLSEFAEESDQWLEIEIEE
jgi:hypothetical protein